ncbi:putative Ig domain-containing protein [Paenibacillus oleatilyticus]|uniref:putative Ig domain-containing protein n=1 Tax=Paenibacillus oleatilyticus TaxID=2594886 RepID=UPI001C1F7BB1|nr:putative Ig domain-containing protein [Paenibacillus oleatilyticus]MBU7315157.1 putative Ig domain-containing protein [Paenibacillus oleatilyticus]
MRINALVDHAEARQTAGFVRTLAVFGGAAVLLLLLSMFAASSAFAATITVDTIADIPGNCSVAGQCSLRAAVNQSNGSGGSNTIQIPAGTYVLNSGELAIRSNVAIIGAGGDPNGNPADTVIKQTAATGNRVFNLNPDSDTGYSISLKALTVSGGQLGAGELYGGGGILGYTGGQGTVTIENCVVTGNSVSAPGHWGGGMNIAGLPGGKVVLRNTVVQGNTAVERGGGVHFEGDMNIDVLSSIIDGNIASNGLGGGMTVFPASAGGQIRIDGTTISRNQANGTIDPQAGGGGLYLSAPSSITNTTISGNTAKGKGGGLYVASKGNITLTHATLFSNNADQGGGGLYVQDGNPKLQNTLAAGNSKAGSAASDLEARTGQNVVAGIDATSSYNLIGLGGNALIQEGNGNLLGVADPGVLPLGANGGLGETNALKGSSPAIGKGSNALAAAFDQRGFPRKKNVAVDIGAYEGLPDAAIGVNGTYDVILPWDETKLSGLTASSSNQTVVPNGNVVITGSGATRTLTVSPTAGGTADIQVTANSSVSGMPRSVSTSFKLTVTGPPDLSISKTHTGDFTQGQTGAVYTIAVENGGGGDTSGTVTVKDTLPAGLTAAQLGGTGWTCDTGTLVCTRTDALAAGASYPDITLKVNVVANAPASVTNTAEVSGGGDANAANNTASDPTNIIQLPDLTIEKSHTGNFKQGQTGAAYTIIVRNAGTGTTSGTVTVADTLPVGMTVTGFAGVGWACDAGMVTCSRSDALASGDSYPPITLTVDVAANAAALLTNKVNVSGGGDVNNANNTASDPTTIIPVADLTIAKSHTGSFTQGQASAVYTITVTNSGQGTTDGSAVTVTDTLPAGLTLKGLGGNGWSCDSGTLSCTRSDALAGGNAYPPLTVTVSVDQDAPAGVTNSAVVSGGGEIHTGNNSASDATAIHPKPQIATSSLPQGTVGVAYSQALTATGGDGMYVWAVTGGALPAGVTFDAATAKLSGTPTMANSHSFTVQLTDGNGVTATKELTIQVNPVLEVSTTSVPHGAVGAAYTASLAAAGGNGVYAWSIAAGTVPGGLTLAADGTLSGTPASEGTFSFVVLVTDGNSMTASRALTLQIHPQLVIHAPVLPEGTVGTAYLQQTLSASGGNGTYTWSVASGSLPAGMMFDPATAALGGTPAADGTYSFTVQVADGNGVKATKAVTLLIRAALTVQTPELPEGTVGIAYANQEFSAAGGSGTYTWSVSGTLPAGLTFAVDPLDPKKAFVQGKPTAAGAYEFQIQVKDSNGVTVVKDLSIQVNPELTFTAAPLPEGTVGLTYAGGTLSAAGGSGTYRWSVEDGRLPDGLTLNASRGTIDGTPKESAVYTVTIQVKDGNGIAVSKVLTLKIHPPVLLGIAFEASEYAVLTGETRDTVVKATYSDSKVVRLTAGVVYTIKDTSVAVVNSSGQLTGIKSGSTVLAATYGGIKAETSILVNKSITGLAFDRPSYSLKVGEQANTVVSATYGGGRIVLSNGVIYSVKDAAIAEVDLHGVVTGKKAGTTVVSATYGEDTVQATIVVNLEVTLTGIRFTPDTYELKTGQTVPSVLIADFSDKSTTPIGRGAVYTFQTEGIARINEEGLVTALQPGTTVLTATYGGRSATAVIRVSARSDGGSGGDSDSGSSPSTGTGPAPMPTPGGITVNLRLSNGSKETINVSQDDIRTGFVRVTASDSSAYVELPSATIAKLLAMNPELSILFQTAGGLIELPLAQIDPQTLAKLLGLPADDFHVNVGIRTPDAQEREQLGEALRRMGGKELAAPADFYVRITDNKGNEVKQNVFTSYIVRTLPLNGQANAATATGVWWDPEAREYRFVPTVFETWDGKPVAKLKRQGFSVYTVLDRSVSFGDLQGHWAKATIESLASKLIVQGRKADAYEPEGRVTRAEWAALLVRSLGLNVSQEKAPFGDVKDGDWFAAAVGAAHRVKLIDGYEDGTFRPNQTVTREELAAMTTRAIKYVGAKPADIRSDSESFHDSANISGWADGAVRQAVKAGIIEGDDQGRFRPSDSASRAEAATMLYRLLKAISFI